MKQPSSYLTYNNILSVESSIYQELVSFQMVNSQTNQTTNRLFKFKMKLFLVHEDYDIFDNRH